GRTWQGRSSAGATGSLPCRNARKKRPQARPNQAKTDLGGRAGECQPGEDSHRAGAPEAAAGSQSANNTVVCVLIPPGVLTTSEKAVSSIIFCRGIGPGCAK